ncbi:hypothetical protein E3N88_20800 [Mikania micrantha]|uniref:Uncharacterized protein n=1 Tax=Mikania micrantha TaxID=192012 RepID=A0A5N6NKH9_9ASTR|nr:hypothetical protein E3N88_20800 [Mikania micrantha]
MQDHYGGLAKMAHIGQLAHVKNKETLLYPSHPTPTKKMGKRRGKWRQDSSMLAPGEQTKANGCFKDHTSSPSNNRPLVLVELGGLEEASPMTRTVTSTTAIMAGHSRQNEALNAQQRAFNARYETINSRSAWSRRNNGRNKEAGDLSLDQRIGTDQKRRQDTYQREGEDVLEK